MVYDDCNLRCLRDHQLRCRLFRLRWLGGLWFSFQVEWRNIANRNRRTCSDSWGSYNSRGRPASAAGLLLLWRPDSNRGSQFDKALLQQFLEPPQVGRGMRIAAEAEIHGTVVTQDGTVDRHLASNRNIRITVQHPVPEQIKRHLGPRHIRADKVEGSDGQLARQRTSYSLQRRREHPNQPASQTD